MPGVLFLCRALSILPSKVWTVMQRRSPHAQVQAPHGLPSSSSDPLGSCFRVDVVDSDLWLASFGFSLSPAQDEEWQMAWNTIKIVKCILTQMKRLMTRGTAKTCSTSWTRTEFEENKDWCFGIRERDKTSAKNPKQCKKLVELVRSVSSKAPKPKVVGLFDNHFLSCVAY